MYLELKGNFKTGKNPVAPTSNPPQQNPIQCFDFHLFPYHYVWQQLAAVSSFNPHITSFRSIHAATQKNSLSYQ